jgi:UDP-glucuronate decarboxylase
MWTESAVLKEDLELIHNSSFIDWEKLRGRTILVTGGTGLIGSTLINGLLYADLHQNLNITVIALVRDTEKAKALFSRQSRESKALNFVRGSVERLPCMGQKVDYIIHGASPTASLFFAEHPVETINMIVEGTKNLLELGKKDKVASFVFLSSMEVYGAPNTDQLISECQGCSLDSMSVRSCYPLAKRLCENLCASYTNEYGVPAKVIRLAQTFGPGVSVDDQRVFAEFSRNVLMGNDIILQTPGASKHCYLYTADAVTAILTVMLRGQAGNAYNAGNPKTYCSILDMAMLVRDRLGNGRTNVVLPHSENNLETIANKFPPTHKINLDVTKLVSLGWHATYDLEEMYRRMIDTFKSK